MRVVIIGAGAAGLTTAMELRRLDKKTEITLVDKSDVIGYSPCSLPYVIAGEIDEMDVISTDEKDLADVSVVHAEAMSIDRRKRVVVHTKGSAAYDFLVLAAGSTALVPDACKGAMTLRTIDDARRIIAASKKAKSIVIAGGGLAGIEIAAALKKATLIEVAPNLAPLMLDADMASVLERHLNGRGIRTLTSCSITRTKKGTVATDKGDVPCDLLISATGVVPNIALAKNAGLACGRGIAVDAAMRTSDSRIFACGDCAEVSHFLTAKKRTSQSATTAVRQAKSIAMTISGRVTKAPAPLDASVSVADGMHFGSVGVTSRFAEANGVRIVSAACSGKDMADYHPHARDVKVKVIATNGTVIGVQAIGGRCVPEIINTASLAISKRMKLADLAGMETCYNPAAAPLFHAMSTAAGACMMKMKHK